eukprot:766603-Hanusia_phi.AAC.7
MPGSCTSWGDQQQLDDGRNSAISDWTVGDGRSVSEGDDNGDGGGGGDDDDRDDDDDGYDDDVEEEEPGRSGNDDCYV